MTYAMDPHRCALRMIAHTLAMGATLTAPAALQAALLMRPDAFAPDHAAAAMSGVLAAAIVGFPALLKSLLAGAPVPPGPAGGSERRAVDHDRRAQAHGGPRTDASFGKQGRSGTTRPGQAGRTATQVIIDARFSIASLARSGAGRGTKRAQHDAGKRPQLAASGTGAAKAAAAARCRARWRAVRRD